MMGEKWIEYTVGMGRLRSLASAGLEPSDQGTDAALEVENFEDAIAQLKEHKIPFAEAL